MKILQINSVCGIGSTGKIATDIRDILNNHGHECKIAYGRGEVRKVPIEDTMKIGTNIDIYMHALLTRITDRTGFYSTRATKKLITEIEEYQPDVIHLHNLHGYYVNIEILFEFLEKYKKPVIWTLHDCWSFTGHCVYFDFVKCDKWKNQCEKCSKKSSYPKSSLLDNSKKNYMDKKRLFTSIDNMTIVTPSKWLASLVEKSYLRKYPVQVIHNGIDLDVFKPIENDFREIHHIEDKIMVLGVADMWGRRKGLNDFVQLSTMLDERYVIVLVGLSEKQVRKLPKNIIGIKRTYNVEELVEIYSTADVFVNPTYEDNFPTVNLEALACATPVVTYDTGGSPECIDEKTGIIVDKGNVNELLRAIEYMCDKLNIKRNSCINHSLNFSTLRKFGEYIELYDVI